MSSPSQSKQKSPQTTADASQTKAEVESDHSQQQQSISSNRYGDLTNLLHAAAALSELPNHDVDMKGGKKEVSGVSVPVSDDDAKTVPTITITTNTTTNTTNTTAQDKVVEKHVNPPPSYYPPPIYHTNGPIYVHDRNQMQMMHPPQQMQAIEFEQDGKTKRPYTNTRHTFPLKLMEILNSKTDFSDIIRWSRNGTSFQIIDPMKLCETVLPLYFPGEKVKYPSFTRKLNRWGFRQISRGPDGGAFFHEVSCECISHMEKIYSFYSLLLVLMYYYKLLYYGYSGFFEINQKFVKTWYVNQVFEKGPISNHLVHQ